MQEKGYTWELGLRSFREFLALRIQNRGQIERGILVLMPVLDPIPFIYPNYIPTSP